MREGGVVIDAGSRPLSRYNSGQVTYTFMD